MEEREWDECDDCGVKHGPRLQDLSVHELADIEYKNEQRIALRKLNYD